MKKRWYKENQWIHLIGITFLIMFLLLLVPFKADASARVLTGIQATYRGSDIQKGYYFNASDVAVTAYYSDNTWEVVTNFTLSTTYISQVGANTITAYYNGMSATFTVVGYEVQTISYYTVYFVTNGGTYVPPITNVKHNTTIELPTHPTRYGFRFRGWYTTSNLVTQFTEDMPILTNTYLYAKWEPKAVVTGDTISSSISGGSYSATITANILGQTYGPNVDLDVTYIDPSYIVEAVKKIAVTDKFLAFDFCMEDFVYSDKKPIPITITIPPTFNASKCAVYYTTNRQTIMGKMTGSLIGSNTYQFNAYGVGSYILMDTESKATTDTDNNSSAYITIEDLDEKVYVNGEVALIVNFHNYSGDEKTVKLYWYSSNPAIADVDDNGVVRAYKRGTITIWVESGDGKLKASKKITIVADKTLATSIRTNVSSRTMRKGTSFQILAKVYPTSASSYVVYSSSKKSIATVTSKGRVVAKKKGSCYIYVRTMDGSKIVKKIKITVK